MRIESLNDLEEPVFLKLRSPEPGEFNTEGVAIPVIATFIDGSERLLSADDSLSDFETDYPKVGRFIAPLLGGHVWLRYGRDADLNPLVTPVLPNDLLPLSRRGRRDSLFDHNGVSRVSINGETYWEYVKQIVESKGLVFTKDVYSDYCEKNRLPDDEQPDDEKVLFYKVEVDDWSNRSVVEPWR